jgi:hypothetical protein
MILCGVAARGAADAAADAYETVSSMPVPPCPPRACPTLDELLEAELAVAQPGEKIRRILKLEQALDRAWRVSLDLDPEFLPYGQLRGRDL